MNEDDVLLDNPLGDGQQTPPVEGIKEDTVFKIDGNEYKVSAKGELLNSDGSVFKTKEEVIEFAKTYKEDENTITTTEDDLTPGTVIEIDGKDYTIDADGSIKNEDGTVFKTKDELKALIESSENEEDLIGFLKEKYPLELKDEQGNDIVFENTPDGINSYIEEIVTAVNQEAVGNTLNQLVEKYPIIESIINYIDLNGSFEGFTQQTDYSKVTIDKENEEQQINIIKDEWKRQNKKGNVDGYITYLKSSGTLYDTAVDSLQTIQDIDKENKEAQEKQLAEAKKQQEEEIKQYRNTIDTILSKGEILNYKLPKDIVINKDGKKVVSNIDNFKNYIFKPVDKDGNTQYSLDLQKKEANASIQKELLDAFIEFTGGSYDSLVEMAINKKEVEKLRINSRKGASATIKVKTKQNNTNAKNEDIVL